MKLTFTLFVLFLSLSAHGRGSEGLGGGDMCEDRIKVIRSDIKQWIRSGRASELDLKSRMTYPRYAEAMLAKIGKASIRCVGQGDPGFPVEIQGHPKTCVFDKSSDLMTCDQAKFLATNETNQYILIHHEYAGLIDLEMPDGANSDYSISNQISAKLVDLVIKQLAIRPETSDVPSGRWQLISGAAVKVLSSSLADAFENTPFKNCSFNIKYDGKGTDLVEELFPRDDNQPYRGREVNFSPLKINMGTLSGGGRRSLYRNLQGQPMYKYVDTITEGFDRTDGTKSISSVLYIYTNRAQSAIEKVIVANSHVKGRNVGTLIQPHYRDQEFTNVETACETSSR